MDEKRKQSCMSDGRGCAHQLRLMNRREKLKLSLLLSEFIKARGSDTLLSLMLFST